MKKVFLIIVMVFICVQESFGGTNRLLIEAQRLLAEATTIAQYEDAKKKFQSAKLDVGYVPEEHDKMINEGIRKCNERIVQLSPKLSINGESSSVFLDFGKDGGYETLSISTNQGTPNVSSLPEWLSLTEITSIAITIKCDMNNSTSSREDWFEVHAGSKMVRVYVSQAAGLEPELKIYEVNIENYHDIIGEDNEGNPVFADTPRYASDEELALMPIIKYGSTTTQTKKVRYKIYDPNGNVWLERDWDEYIFHSGEYKTRSLTPHRGKHQPAGVWQYDIWIDGVGYYACLVTILSKDATYLKVNNMMSSVSVYYDEDGGSKTFTVSTDGDDWSVRGIPSFCEMTNKTETSFTLRCNANTTTYSRNDFLMVVSGGKEVKVNVLQSARARQPETAPVVTAPAVVRKPTVVRNMVLGLNAGLGYELNSESTAYALAVDAAFPLSRKFSLGGYFGMKDADYYENVFGVLAAIGDYHNKKKTFMIGVGFGNLTWNESYYYEEYNYSYYGNEWITEPCVNVRFGILFKRGLYLMGDISSSDRDAAFSIGIGYNFGRFIKMKR